MPSTRWCATRPASWSAARKPSGGARPTPGHRAAGRTGHGKTQLIVSKLALHAGQQLFEAGGASATSSALQLDRHWRNLRTIFSHNPLSHKARVLGDYHLNGTTTEFEQGRVF